MNDALGDNLKQFEEVETSRRLNSTQYTYARLDGRGFSKLTKTLQRPYDEKFSHIMIEVTKFLVKETGAFVGYTQSDEISLGWKPLISPSQLFFDGKIQKLTSVLTGLATAKFMSELNKFYPELAERCPHFDCRIFNVNDARTFVDLFNWRQTDAKRNSVNSLASTVFSHKQLEGISTYDRIHKLNLRGYDINNYSPEFQYGVYCEPIKETYTMDEETRMNIPEKNRPDEGMIFVRTKIESRVQRMEWSERDGITFRQI